MVFIYEYKGNQIIFPIQFDLNQIKLDFFLNNIFFLLISLLCFDWME